MVEWDMDVSKGPKLHTPRSEISVGANKAREKSSSCAANQGNALLVRQGATCAATLNAVFVRQCGRLRCFCANGVSRISLVAGFETLAYASSHLMVQLFRV